MRSLQLCRVHMMADGLDWKRLEELRQLTSLSLSSVSNSPKPDPGPLVFPGSAQDHVHTALAAMHHLEQLTLTEARGNALSQLKAPLTCLVFSLAPYYDMNVADLVRLTSLHTLVCTGCNGAAVKQVRALTHIPNLVVR